MKISLENLRNKIETIITNYPFMVSFGIHSIILFVCYVFFVPTFEVDDVSYMLQTSGKIFNEQPTEYIYFVNIILSKLVATACKNIPNLPGHGLLIFSSLFLAYCQIGAVIFRRYSTVIIVVLYSFFFVIVGTMTFFFLQFTMAATLSGLAGLITLFLDKRLKILPILLISSFFIILSGLLRFHGVLLSYVIIFPVLGYIFLTSQGKKIIIQKSLFSGLLLVFCLLFGKYNQYMHGDDLVRFYNNITAIRDFQKFDQATVESQNQALKAVNWTKNDADLLLVWEYWNKELYSDKNLETVIALLQPSNKTSIWYMDNYSFLVKIVQQRHIQLILSVAILLLFFVPKSKYKFVTFHLGTIILLLVLIRLFMKEPPAHVYFPMFIFFTINILFLTMDEVNMSIKLKEKKTYVYFLVGIYGLIVVYRVNLLHKNSINIRKNNKELKDWIVKMKLSPQTTCHLRPNFPYSSILPFENLSYLNNVISYYEDRHSSGTDDYYMTLITKKTYILTSPDDAFLQLYINYMKEHYNMNVLVRDLSIDHANGNLKVFQFYIGENNK
jgi:hypothetical protein